MSDETRPQRLATLRLLADRLDADERPYVAADVRWIIAELAWQDGEINKLKATLETYRRAVRDLNDLLVEK